MPLRARIRAALPSIALATTALLATAPVAQAQNLRQRISNLFISSSSAENSALIATISDALSSSISSIPIGSTSGSESFHFVGGVPVRSSTSSGPIFAERAQTLGSGRALVGVSTTSFRFATLRGVDMNDIKLTFTHQNVDFPGCDAAFNGKNREYALGNTPQQRFMGLWSDGVPVKELKVTDKP